MTLHGRTLQDGLIIVLAVVLGATVLPAARMVGLPPVAAAVLAAMATALPLALRVRERRREEAGPPSDLSASQATIWVAGIAAMGLALRLVNLGSRTTWEDEMWTLRNIYTADWAELFRVAFEDYWPPLHYVILNLVARVTDTGLLSLRVPSVVFGVLTLVALYPLGHRLTGRRDLAVAGVALLAGMTTHVMYSQEARVYALQLLLVVLSTDSFYRSYWERRISPAFLLWTSLLTYSHSFSSWYFLSAQGAYVILAGTIWRDRQALLKGIASQALVLLLWLPLVVAFLHARTRRGIVVPTQWATGAEATPGLWAVIEQYQGLAVRSWPGAALMGLLFLLAVGGLRRGRSEHDGPVDPKATLLLLCWCAVPLLFSLAVTWFTPMKTFGEIRYHLTVLPGLCLLASAGLGAVRSRAALASVAALLVLLPAIQLPRHFRNYRQPATDAAAAILRAARQPGETIYAGNGYRALGYYLRGITPRIGSAAWDSLTAAHAHLHDRVTQRSVKRGDTYAHEKLDPGIVYVGFHGFNPAAPLEGLRRFVREERDRGGWPETYWVVLERRVREPMLALLEEEGIGCRTLETHEVRGLLVRRCARTGPPAQAAPSG